MLSPRDAARSARRPIHQRTSIAVGVLMGIAIMVPHLVHANARTEPGLERLRDAVRTYPNDPDLTWALARRLAEVGEPEEALALTRRFVATWPDRRPEARIDVARSLLDAGSPEASIEILNEAIAADPRSAMAHFYRGLALRSQGQLERANRAFLVAGRLRPALRSETMLVRALGLFELGDEDGAVDLLKGVLNLDPTEDTALRARLLLRQRELLSMERSWRLDGYAGFEWDSNVTLENNESQTLASDKDDLRGIWGAGATWRAWTGERTSVTLGYRYDQSEHVDLGDFDLLSNSGFVSGTWRPYEQLALRLDGLAWNTRQDGESELTAGSLRPNILYSLGPDWGALRVFAQLEWREYDDKPLLLAWERDASTYGAGIEHFLPLRAEGSWLSMSGSFTRTLTQADSGNVPGGFDGDYDADSWRARARANFALPWQVEARFEAAYTHDRYHNDNASQFLDPSGSKIRKRRDDVLDGRITLTRPIVKHVEVEISWRGSRRISNVDLFDYDKQVIGMLLRFSTD